MESDEKNIRIQIDCNYNLRDIDHIVDDLKDTFKQWDPYVALYPQRCQQPHYERICISQGARFVQILNVKNDQYIAVRITIGEVLEKYNIGMDKVNIVKEAIEKQVNMLASMHAAIQ